MEIVIVILQRCGTVIARARDTDNIEQYVNYPQFTRNRNLKTTFSEIISDGSHAAEKLFVCFSRPLAPIFRRFFAWI